MLVATSVPTKEQEHLKRLLRRGANMNPRWRNGIVRLLRLFVMLSAALLVSTGVKTYAQVHGFSSGSFGHLGQGSAGFHSAAVGHWGVPQHGFAYGSGHGNNWSPAWGHGRFGYAPYGDRHSSGPRFYAYSLHPYPLYVYPRGYRPRYYVRRYHAPRYTGGWHSQRSYYGYH